MQCIWIITTLLPASHYSKVGSSVSSLQLQVIIFDNSLSPFAESHCCMSVVHYLLELGQPAMCRVAEQQHFQTTQYLSCFLFRWLFFFPPIDIFLEASLMIKGEVTSMRSVKMIQDGQVWVKFKTLFLRE